MSYLSDQRQYAQIDERSLELINVSLRLPQLSILGPVLFNLYVNDVTEGVPTEFMRFERLQLAAASFVLGRYAIKQDLLKLGWIPVVERKEQQE